MPLTLISALVASLFLPTNALPRHDLHGLSPTYSTVGNITKPGDLLENTLHAIGGRESLAMISGLRLESS